MGGERAPLTPGLPWEAVLVYHAWGRCGKAQAAGDPGAGRFVTFLPPCWSESVRKITRFSVLRVAESLLSTPLFPIKAKIPEVRC